MVASLKALLNTQFDHKRVMQMTMEATEPLHWTIKVYMEPKDVRRLVALGLRPSILWKGLSALLFGRFSIFSRAEEEPVGPPPVPTVKPQSIHEPAASPDKDETPSPLARLKG